MTLALPAAAGVLFVPCNVAIMAGAGLAGWLIGRRDARLACIVGMLAHLRNRMPRRVVMVGEDAVQPVCD